MTKLEKYMGIIPAFYACYDDEGEISPERVQMLARHYLDVGVKGLYVGGSSGECIYQNVDERKLVLENVMEAVGGKMTIIAHIAAPSTRDSVELAKHAEALDVDALAAIPPYYFVLPGYAIEEYWTSMIKATNKDFFIYNIPQTTGYLLSTDLYQRMLAHPQVIGVKNSSMPVHDIYLFNHKRDNTIILNGPDEQLVAGLVMGAQGGIGGTYGLMPELYMAAFDAVSNNDIQLAQSIQYACNDIIGELTTCHGHMYSVIKAVLRKNGLDIGTGRKPLPDLSPSDEGKVGVIDEMIKSAINKFVK